MPVSPANTAVGPKLLLTGDPGCGKTTALWRVVERLRDRVPMTGFLTEEIRGSRGREGFLGRTLDGRTFRLAHVDVGGPYRIGRYGVDLEGLESVGVPSLQAGEGIRLVVLDEIGKMECFSERFREAVERLLGEPVPLLATVAVHGVGFVKRVRNDPRVTLVRMRRESRAGVVGELLRALTRFGVDAGPGARVDRPAPRRRRA